MEKLYFLKYGCYLEEVTDVMLADLSTDEKRENFEYELYNEARQVVENWVGSHGFADYELEDFSDEDEYIETINEEIEGALEYSYEEFDPEEHGGQFTTDGAEHAMAMYHEWQRLNEEKLNG